ncbi:MFS transporter [Streptomyces sp. CS090A]|uniref:MFS transporter n=1 Tax=Streptomyces sp. CS090A TaxID=2162710 RepID=UPI000D50FA54|nr:MFS transporter [Streptomyces sp. CS090A]PVC96491.1 MFS transporter [Streptomyces sp. CS090A]
MTHPRTIGHGGPPAPHGRWTPALWGLLLVLAGNMLIDALEVSVALVALPAIGQDLGIAGPRLHWVVSGFAVGFGALLLFGARLVALLGRRPVYLAALLVFAAASLAGALTDAVPVLIATRFVKGFCAALTAPTGLAIIAATFPEGRERARAVSVYTLCGGCGFSAGLLLSGVLTEASWRWTFAFPAPVALLLFAFALRLIPHDTPGNAPERTSAKQPARSYGFAGALTLTGGVLLLLYALTSGAEAGWAHARTLGSFAAAGLLLVAFVRVERGARQPLVRRQLLRDRHLVRSALGAAALNGSFLGLLFLSTLHLQRTAGWTPLQTALAFLPASVPLAASALYSGRMVARFGPARLIVAGAALPPLGYLLALRQPVPVRYVTDVLPTMLLVGAGFVLAFTALHMQATSRIPAERQGAASGIYQTAVQMGAAFVLAPAAVLRTDSHRLGLLLVTVVGALGLAVALTGVRPQAPRAHPESGP